MRVVLLVLDAFPNRWLDARVAPTLFRLASSGGWAPEGGWASMTSATYPNHATFATGAEPARHGIRANHVLLNGRIRPAEEAGPAVPTLFDGCQSSGLSSEAVLGDHHLVGVVGAGGASRHWPTGGTRPAGVALDAFGYTSDDVTIDRILEAIDRGPDLLFAQLNEPDTEGHRYGPDTPAAVESYRRCDERVRLVADALAKVWDETVLMVVSDHDMDTMRPEPPIDLAFEAVVHEVPATVIHEGTAALVVGQGACHDRWLDDVAGVSGSAELERGVRLVWADEGRWFGASSHSFMPGMHGGFTTRTQVAVVAGGHPAVASIGRSLAVRRPNAADWGATAADLLGISLPAATGVAMARNP